MQDSTERIVFDEWSENRKIADPVRVEMLELLEEGCSFQSVLSRALKRIAEGRLSKTIENALVLVPVKYMMAGSAGNSPAKFLTEYLQGSPQVSELAWACARMNLPLVEVFEVIVSPETARAWVALLSDYGLEDTIAQIQRLTGARE